MRQLTLDISPELYDRWIAFVGDRSQAEAFEKLLQPELEEVDGEDAQEQGEKAHD